jgi:hypothetical protein
MAPPPCEKERDRERQRERKWFLSHTFPPSTSLLDLFSVKETMQEKMFPSVGIEPLTFR